MRGRVGEDLDHLAELFNGEAFVVAVEEIVASGPRISSRTQRSSHLEDSVVSWPAFEHTLGMFVCVVPSIVAQGVAGEAAA